MPYAYDVTTATPLCEIMGRHGSDKGDVRIAESWHNYTTFYHSIFEGWRGRPLRVFELGLGTNNVSIPSNMGPNGRPGASLRGWAEYFPRALVFGADIDRDILFRTDRIATYYCDQTKPMIIRNMWNEPELAEGFDVVVEDGLHAFSANVCFFENSVHKLNRGGFYITEDIHKRDLPLFAQKIAEDWKPALPECDFEIVCLPTTRNAYGDNNLMVVRRH